MVPTAYAISISSSPKPNSNSSPSMWNKRILLGRLFEFSARDATLPVSTLAIASHMHLPVLLPRLFYTKEPISAGVTSRVIRPVAEVLSEPGGSPAKGVPVDGSHFSVDLRAARLRLSRPANQRFVSVAPNRRRSLSRRSAFLRNLHAQVAGVVQASNGRRGASRSRKSLPVARIAAGQHMMLGAIETARKSP